MKEFLTVSDISKRSGVKSSTIRHYEKIGVLPTPYCANNGYRIYEEHVLVHIDFIKKFPSLGFSIEEIKQLDALRKHLKADYYKADKIILGNFDKVREKIAHLRSIEQLLMTVCDCCQAQTVKPCKVMEMLDTYRGRGGHEYGYYQDN